MNMNLVDEFLEQEHSSGILSFFKQIKNDQWDYLFLVTRKGYWLYKTISFTHPEIVPEGDREVMADGVLMTTFDDANAKDKTVYLVDDTLSKGFTLFRYFCVLKKRGFERVIPKVYALSTEFPSPVYKDTMRDIFHEVYGKDCDDADKYRKKFIACLEYHCYMNQERMSTLCLDETKLFQNSLCPFVVDFPIMVRRTVGNVGISDKRAYSEKTEDYKEQDPLYVLQMDAKTYEKICESDELWKFRSVPTKFDGRKMEISNDIDGEKIQFFDYFEYDGDWVRRLEKTFLQNAIVRCRKKKVQEGYKVTFVPCAVVRSCTKDELYQIFVLLFQDTLYGKEIQEKNNNISQYEWIGMFRAVIFVLSLIIGDEFKMRLSNMGIGKIDYDWDLLKESFGKIFQESIKEIDNIISQKKEAVAQLVFEKPDMEMKMGEIKRKPYQLKGAYELAHINIDEDNYCIYSEKKQNFWGIEKLEELLEERYVFNDDREKRNAVTSIAEIMLGYSICGGNIKVDGERIINGLRHGENSDLLLSRSEMAFYIGAEVLYICCGKNDYEKCKTTFFDQMKLYIVQKGYFGSGIEEELFDKYRMMFTKTARADIHFQIMGKRFLVRNIKDSILADIQNWAINMTDKLVKGDECYGQTAGDGFDQLGNISV